MQAPTDSFSFIYHWQAGSMPPPHHYTLEIRASSAGDGTVVLVAGYAFENPPRWEETFTSAPAALARLRQAVAAAGVFERAWVEAETDAIGGSLRWFCFRRGAHSVDIPAQLNAADTAFAAALEEAIRGLVPDSLWQTLRQRHDEYRRGRGDD